MRTHRSARNIERPGILSANNCRREFIASHDRRISTGIQDGTSRTTRIGTHEYW